MPPCSSPVDSSAGSLLGTLLRAWCSRSRVSRALLPLSRAAATAEEREPTSEKRDMLPPVLSCRRGLCRQWVAARDWGCPVAWQDWECPVERLAATRTPLSPRVGSENPPVPPRLSCSLIEIGRARSVRPRMPGGETMSTARNQRSSTSPWCTHAWDSTPTPNPQPPIALRI